MISQCDTEQRPTVCYRIGDNLYVNMTSRCTLRCSFCLKFRGIWRVRGNALRVLRSGEPSVTDVLAEVGHPETYREIVFCGLGEPTMRLRDVLQVARLLRARGAFVRLNTDGLANLRHGYDVTPSLEGCLDAVSISLNAQDAATYNRLCRPRRAGAHAALLDFAMRARKFVPNVTLTAIHGLPGVDITACESLARTHGLRFRLREIDDIAD